MLYKECLLFNTLSLSSYSATGPGEVKRWEKCGLVVK